MQTNVAEGVYLLRGEAQSGPYTLDEVRELLTQGLCGPFTMAWWDGAPDWVLLSQLPGLVTASKTPAAPKRFPAPTPPPSGRRTSASAEQVHGDISAFWGKVGSAFLIPLIGLVILGAWLGFPKIGAFFVFLGCYNAYLAVRSCEGVLWRKVMAWFAVLTNTLYALMTLGMFMAGPTSGIPDSSSRQPSQGASGKATLIAWQDYLEAFSGLSTSQANSAGLERVVIQLSGIETTGVDRDLAAHIQESCRFMGEMHGLVSDFEGEFATIQSNTRAGELALGMLFGAVAAENSNGDPYGDALRAGYAGGALANEAGNLALYQLQMKYMPRAEALESRRLRLHQNEQRLRGQLASRYDGGF